MKTDPSRSTLAVAAPLFLVLFIDGMGLGLLFPILNGILVDPSSGFLTQALSSENRDILYGVIIGIFMICWFFGATILGDLSDHVGRKKSLMICLVGSFLGYLLSAIAIYAHSLSLLVLGRVIAGFTAGSQPIAQAAIVDLSSEEHKTRNIGLILLAVSLGFIFGPMLGGVLSDPRLVSWFDFATPLFFASFISLLNAVALQALFKETFKTTGQFKLKPHRAVELFISAFREPKIRLLSLVMLIMIFGWSNYFSFISLYLLHVFHYKTLYVSLFMSVLGLGFSIGCGFLVDYCAHRFSLKMTVVVNLIIASILVWLTVASHNELTAWILSCFIGMAIAVAYSMMITLFSNQVNADEQGWIMGVTGSIMALCFGLTSFLTGWVATFSSTLPLYLAAAGLGVSGLILLKFKQQAQ